MKGAKEYYNIVRSAYNKKLGELRQLNLRHGWHGGDSEAFIYNNFIFVTSSHARGKCFNIFLVEDINMSDEELKTSAFKVYGVVGGQRGWTEEYGWTHKGKWCMPILKYLKDLQIEIEQHDLTIAENKRLKQQEENKKIGIEIDKFNKIFV